MSKSDCFVSVITAIRNNTDIIEGFVNDLAKILKQHYENYEIILVDNYSTDDTLNIINALLSKEKCIRVIRLSKNFGVELALTAGLESSIGDFVVIMDANTDPPEKIPEMIALARKGKGIIVGTAEYKVKRSFLAKLFQPVFYFFIEKILKLNFYKNASYFQVLSRQALNSITRIRQKRRYIRILTANIGYKVQLFPYKQICRSNKNIPKVGVAASFLEAIDMMVANSMLPLRIVSIIGTMGCLITLSYICYIIVVNLIKNRVMEGWTTLSFQVTSLFMLIFIILTVLCEYVGRVLEESIERPLYYVIEELDSTVVMADEQRRNVLDKSIES
ncbi:glycosyltransferase [bacterium]|nr:glycosyltransferase [bacterium]